ncbi:MAG: hypothetical protein KDD09_26910, partial [Phaeodactylibacter sp.]|nr:hypothetical protein [Phaeodactylibacter sp.]
ERMRRLEPVTSTLARFALLPIAIGKLHPLVFYRNRADEETQTRDLNFGRVRSTPDSYREATSVYFIFQDRYPVLHFSEAIANIRAYPVKYKFSKEKKQCKLRLLPQAFDKQKAKQEKFRRQQKSPGVKPGPENCSVLACLDL